VIQVFLFLCAIAVAVGFCYSAASLRRLLYLLYFVSLIEGVFINYFYPQKIFLLGKDVLVLYIYLLFLLQGHLRAALARTGTLLIPLGLYAALYTVHVFNPAMNNVLVGLVGLRVAIFYLPLLFVGQVAFESHAEVARFVRTTLLLTIPVCAYGIYQNFGGEDHIATLGRGYVERGVALLYGNGKSVEYTFRTLSTFTYSSSFSIFIILMAPLLWALYRGARGAWRWAAACALLLLLAAQISSGGRQALVFTAAALLLCELLQQGRLSRKLWAPLLLGVGLALGFFVLGEDKLSRYEAILDVDQVRWRYETYFVRHNLDAIRESPLGLGAGSASTAARHIGGLSFRATETFISKLAYEVGLPGILALLWLMSALCRRLWQVTRGLVDPELALLARAMLAIAVIVLLTSFNGWPLDVPPMNALFWAFAGVALALPALAPATETAAAPVGALGFA
jgi:hypothetical protein